MDELEKYYQYLKSKGADVPDTYQSFRNTLSDENSAKQYYAYLQKNKFDVAPTFDSFQNTFDLKKKDGGSVSTPSLQESSQDQKEVTPTQNINVGQGQQPTKKLDVNYLLQYAKNNSLLGVQKAPEEGQSIYESIAKRDEAINNTLNLVYNQQGKKVDKNSPQYKKDFQDKQDQIQNGDMAVTTAKDGKPFAVNTRGFLPSVGDALINSFKAPIEAVKLMGKSDKELAQYFEEQQKNAPYLESKPSPVAGNLGEIVGGLPKIIGEFAIPVVGEGVAVADQMLSSTGQQTQTLYQKKISDLKQANPNYEPTPEDKAQIAGQARKDAPIEAIPDAAMIMLLKENGSDVGALNESAKTFSSVLKREVNKTANVALAGTGAGAFKTVAEKAQGYNITMKDALDNMGKEGFSYATMQAMFSLAPIVSKMLTPSQAAWKSYMSKVPDEMVDEVTSQMPNGDEIKKDIQDFKTAAQTVPDHYSDEQKVALSHLIQNKNDLKENEDENFKEDNKSQIENIDRNIQAIKQNPGNALDLIPDENTGEHNANPKEFDELSKKEQKGVIVPKDYGEATTKEIGEGENKKYIPKATFTNKQGVIETNEPIKIEDAKEYTDKDKAQQAADNALARHYYENGLSAIEKPQKEIKQAEVIQPKGVEGNKPINEPIPSIETGKESKDVGENLQLSKQENKVSEILGITPDDADALMLIHNAKHLSDIEKKILVRQYKNGVMNLRDIQNYTAIDISKINDGEEGKWARTVLKMFQDKWAKKVNIENIDFEEIPSESKKQENVGEVVQPTEQKVEATAQEYQNQISDLEQKRNTDIKNQMKDNSKLDLIPAKDLIKAKDPIEAKQQHNIIKEKYKALKQLLDCI